MILPAADEREDLAQRHNIITGSRFIKALLAAGIVKVEDQVSRIVIDVRADRVITLYGVSNLNQTYGRKPTPFELRVAGAEMMLETWRDLALQLEDRCRKLIVAAETLVGQPYVNGTFLYAEIASLKKEIGFDGY